MLSFLLHRPHCPLLCCTDSCLNSSVFQILIPPKGLFTKLKKEAENPREVLDQVNGISSFFLSDSLVYLWLCFVQACSDCGESGLLFSVVRGLLVSQSTDSGHVGFSRHSTWALERSGLAAPRRVESSQIRVPTRVPCIGRRATREVQN